MPCDSHLHTGLAHIRKGGHDHLHGNSILVCWWGASHGAGGVGDPGTPVKLKIKHRQRENRLTSLCVGCGISKKAEYSFTNFARASLRKRSRANVENVSEFYV
ncbi:hypothetical protein PFLUV_G00162960 [Perca fluviatilis]|uniref:Uncharacterized protein n=1 Tax=Perca fluviatilis TaxID=8168 RepID=A0A6A5EHQ6_PERFL|nr:hypothetical protein PFLUV_G00162960 [Perca fluviatilis]